MSVWERLGCWLLDRRELHAELERTRQAERYWRECAEEARAVQVVASSCTGPQKHIWLAHQAEQAEARAEAADGRMAEALEETARLGRDLAELRAFVRR